MSRESKEVKTYFGRCRCCLGYGYLNNMWKEYQNGDEIEIYGVMLTECYSLSWEQPESMDHDQICNNCVKKLRSAYDFRKLVIRSQSELLDESESDKLTNTHFKVEDIKVEVLDDDSQLESVTVGNEGDECVFSDADESNLDMDVVKENVLYEDIEYLEEEIALDTKGAFKEQTTSSSGQTDRRKTSKWPKKLPTSERNKRYLQYSADDIRDALDAVRNKKMTILEASEFYKVPRKTLTGKLRSEGKKGVASNPKQDRMYNFLKEIKTILTYTNGTPYKSKISQYGCMYCTAAFNDPADMRNHTRTMHMDDRTKKIDLVMRPHWQNEILKLDIENLLCVVCCLPIYDWNSMFQHMKEAHQVDLDQSYRRVIPYNLGLELECALCKEKFTSYHQLDGHMNTHYDNYVCVSCGDTFLTLTRLKSHMKIHLLGTWPCTHCPKVFNTEHNRKKHESIVHARSLVYKCMFCDVRFNLERDRKAHVTSVHADKISIMTCELCGKTFNWRHYFISHMRMTHGSKQFECSSCGKKFARKGKLEKHFAVRHKDD